MDGVFDRLKKGDISSHLENQCTGGFGYSNYLNPH